MAQQLSKENEESLQGTVRHLTFFNAENGYFVARVDVPGKGERTVVGNTPVITVGEQISARGTWKSSTWGPQFKASETTLSVPTALEGIEKYLANGIQGIGKGYAKKLVAAFGEAVFQVIENTPDLLAGVKGIGAKRAASIISAYQEQKGTREVMVFLHTCGMSTLRAQRVYKKYGDAAIKVIKANPYVLCTDIWGVGFASADAVARRQGIAADSEYRIRAGVLHTLREAEGQGSCGLPLEMVLDKASQLLAVEYPLIERCIDLELLEGNLVKDTASGVTCLFRKGIYQGERFIAKKLLEHARRVPAVAIHDLEQRITDAEVEIGIALEEAQREAVRVALSSPVCVITGGPGTGKTTITRVLLNVLVDAGLTEVRLAAPTGKAAKRASEATGFDGKTVHRLLEIDRDGKFKYNQHNPLDCDALVIDEFSMLDVALTSSVLKALSPATRLLIIGDVDQLPSVGPGKVLSDIIDSGAIPTVRLNAIFRQAATSKIISNAHAINRGEMPDVDWKQGSDFCFSQFETKLRADDEEKRACREKIAAEVVRLARDMYKLGYDPIRDVQVLAPMRRGQLGVEALNARLQEALNPHPATTLDVYGVKWGVGDKVMQVRNNYEKTVFNGDIGYIKEITESERSIVVEFDGVEVVYKSSELDELRQAFAFTIHKSQGSECPVVILPIEWSHYTMLKRNLLYTGVTRAKKLCVLVGQKPAVKKAVESAQKDERYSRLLDCLRAGLPPEVRNAD